MKNIGVFLAAPIAASLAVGLMSAHMARPGLSDLLLPDYRDDPVVIPKHRKKGLPPPPNPKAERRKQMAVRAMQERKRKRKWVQP